LLPGLEVIGRQNVTTSTSGRRPSPGSFKDPAIRGIDVKRRSREFCGATEDFFAIPDPAEGCDDCLDAIQRDEFVRAALGALPQEQFTLVRLAYFEGLSHSAIARWLSLPLGTVKSRLRLACARLHRLLLDAGVTEACIAG